MSYIKFEQLKFEGKTKKFSLYSNNDPMIFLGEIKYNPNWRKYCFYPNDYTLFDAACLNEIVDKINSLMLERRAA